jgi:hypothetical protein
MNELTLFFNKMNLCQLIQYTTFVFYTDITSSIIIYVSIEHECHELL